MKSKNLRLRDIEDYFGNPIEPGDVVLRSRFGAFQKRKVIKITERYLYVKRDSIDRFPNLPNPLKIELYYDMDQPHLINLTKLNLT